MSSLTHDDLGRVRSVLGSFSTSSGRLVPLQHVKGTVVKRWYHREIDPGFVRVLAVSYAVALTVCLALWAGTSASWGLPAGICAGAVFWVVYLCVVAPRLRRSYQVRVRARQPEYRIDSALAGTVLEVEALLLEVSPAKMVSAVEMRSFLHSLLPALAANEAAAKASLEVLAADARTLHAVYVKSMAAPGELPYSNSLGLDLATAEVVDSFRREQ